MPEKKLPVNTPKRKTSLSKTIFIFALGLIPIVPIILLILFNNIPETIKPYFMELSGTWKIHEGFDGKWLQPGFDDRNWKTLSIPGGYYEQGFRDTNSVIRKTVTLDNSLLGQNMFILVGSMPGGVARVYINGQDVGEFGNFDQGTKIDGLTTMMGFSIPAIHFTNRQISISLRMYQDNLGFDGIQDTRFYLGAEKYLKPYFYKNLFLSDFFHNGILFFNFLMSILLTILLVVNWKDRDRYKYIITIMVILSGIFFTVINSGAFVFDSFGVRISNQISSFSICLVILTCFEFIIYFFSGKVNWLCHINRIICLTGAAIFLFVRDSVFDEMIYGYLAYYFTATMLFVVVYSFYFTFIKRTKEFGFNIFVAFLLLSTTGIIDLMSNLGMLHLPPLFSITVSIFSVVSTTIILADFINIALSNKKLTVTLSEANENLKEMDRLKDQFLANTSHELRTPLNGIFGLVEAVIDGADGEVNEKVKGHLSLVLKSASNLKSLVNNILDLSKVRAGLQDLDIKPYQISDIIENEVKPSVSGLVMNKPLTLDFHVAEGLPVVYADKDKIRQIMINLIGNAVKFTDRGSVSVNAVLYDRKIADGDVPDSADKKMVLISVRDTGIGMKQSDLKIIFEEFRQADGSSTRKYEGTGLGLSITKKLVETLGGMIWVESSPGKGSTFYFTLPTTPDARPADPKAAATREKEGVPPVKTDRESQTFVEKRKTDSNFNSSSRGFLKDPSGSREKEIHEILAKGNGEKILLVDDLEINLEALRLNLKDKGYHVSKALSAMEALEIMGGERFDMIISDVMMPEMDGYQLLEKIRLSHEGKSLPIILLTAKTRYEDKKKGLDLGANDYIVKPFDMADLLARMRKVLDEKKDTPGVDADEKEKIMRFTKLVKGNGEQILVVDDNPVNLEVLVTRLEMNGWKVMTSESGAEALEKYKETKPDIVLLDIMMPGMNGYEVCWAIREELHDLMTPIIFLTAKQEKEDKIYGINMGGDDYITKPFDKDDLVIRIANHIKNRQMLNKLKKKELLEYDIQMAGKIQNDLFPREFPVTERAEFYGGSKPAKGVGGDYFDIVKIGEHKFLCVIADVMGKGLSASLVMVKVQTLIWSLAKTNPDLISIAKEINGSVMKDLKGERYVTATLLVYDTARQEVEILNLGHDPLLFYRAKERKIEVLDVGVSDKNIPLGLKEDLTGMETSILKMNPGDAFAIYTDGILEAMNRDKEQFGMDRFKKLFQENSDKHTITIYKAVMDSVAEFTKETEQSDDITLFLAKSI